MFYRFIDSLKTESFWWILNTNCGFAYRSFCTKWLLKEAFNLSFEVFSCVYIAGVGQYSIDIRRNEGNGQLSLRNTLTIRNLTKENEGSYICKAFTSNQHLSDMKTLEMHLRVQCKQFIIAFKYQTILPIISFWP